MLLSPAEQIRLILRRQGLTIADLAEKTGQSRQNLTNKLNRDNFQVSELETLASALDCELKIEFVQIG